MGKTFIAIGVVLLSIGALALVLGLLWRSLASDSFVRNDTDRLLALVAVGSTLVLAILTGIYVSLTKTMLDEVGKQTVLASPAVLTLEPEFQVKGKPGIFDLEIRNRGLSEVSDIQLDEDYYVLIAPKDGPRQYVVAGVLIALPNKTWESLKPRESISFKLDFTKELEQMNRIYLDKSSPGTRMSIARFTIRFRRAVDGKEFVAKKAYIIAGDGSALFDHERDMPRAFGPTWKEVKRDLGVD